MIRHRSRIATAMTAPTAPATARATRAWALLGLLHLLACGSRSPPSTPPVDHDTAPAADAAQDETRDEARDEARDAAPAADAALDAATPDNGGAGDATVNDAATRDDAPADVHLPVVDPAATLGLMRRVADYELVRFGATTNNNWVRAVFYTGLMALHRSVGDDKYLAAARSWGLANGWRLGPDRSSAGPAGPAGALADPRWADNQACVQTYAELYLEDAASQNNATLTPARAAFDQMVAAPRTGRAEWWWCDALFMAPAALVRAARATGQTAYIDLMDGMYWDTVAFLFDPVQHLFWRDSSFLNMPIYWSRGNGWVVAGIARILDQLPAADPRRGRYEDLLRTLAAKLLTIQGADGFWRSNLIDPNAFPNPESSGTAFFCYGLAWGINHGVLDRATYQNAVVHAWQALGSVVDAQGRLGYVQPVGARPGPAAATDTNDYASGALLLAGSQLLQL